MLQAVHFTHEEGNIVHTDLKPANFLMANGRLKLIDFGIAQKIPVGTIHIKRDAMIGTPNYMAPETVRAVKEAKSGGPRSVLAPVTSGPTSGGPGSTATSAAHAKAVTTRVYKAGKASDVWALGCILFQMVYNRPPFEAFHGDDKLREILDPKHRIEFADTRYGPRQRSHSDGIPRDGQALGAQDNGDDDDEDDGVLEAVDEELRDVMRLTLTYSAKDRITIPALFEHPLLLPLEQQRRREAEECERNARLGNTDDEGGEQGNDDDEDDDEAVQMTRAELKDVLRKMYAFARNGELREGNLDARSDALFDNIRKRQQQQAT